MRRSQTYEVEVFDQIPALLLATPAGAFADTNDRPELRKALQNLMGNVEFRRLHDAAEAMLELGDDQHEDRDGKITWSASRSFQHL